MGIKPENSTITAIHGIHVGHYTDSENMKGCTVIRFAPEGVAAAVDVRGSAPGTGATVGKFLMTVIRSLLFPFRLKRVSRRLHRRIP